MLVTPLPWCLTSSDRYAGRSGLLNPYPYRAADRIVPLKMIDENGRGSAVNSNGPQIQALQQVPVVESVLTTGYHAMNLKGPEFPESVSVTSVSGNIFEGGPRLKSPSQVVFRETWKNGSD
jgi:hypothetical protein